MGRYCIVVADAARARLFSHRPEHSKPRACSIVEQKTLVDPEQQAKPHEVFSATAHDSRGRVMGNQYGVGNGVERHEEDHERRFAARVTEEALQLARAEDAKEVVLVANPRMLGRLRLYEADLTRAGLEVHELQQELTRLPVHEIAAHLEAAELIPKNGALA